MTNYKLRAIYFTALIAVTACNSPGNGKIAEKQTADVLKTAKPPKKFSDVKFASKIDTSCGMPIVAGLEDTVVLKGKVYGFCSPECKAQFVNILKTQKKR